ncbi:MAG: transketolase [Candidatus Cloacimonetes bacterium]|nr:transketolase [Candidatus Cloacimonadota bacterium]
MEALIKPKISIEDLKIISNKAKSAILTMTTLSKSGHPGGSMSSLDILLALYFSINFEPDKADEKDRDRVVISHGHISPAVYSALAFKGFFNIEDAITQFRLAGSVFEGHIEPEIPGIDWATGNLGQGLSAATAFALNSKLRKYNSKIYCIMGDGEQQKGQLSEARRFAIKYKLNNLVAFVDYNKLQISGDITKVMPQNIKENYESDGWEVIQINGHNYEQIFKALNQADKIDKPVLILAETVMGNGVSFMENKEKYHGSPIKEEDLVKAYEELGYAYSLDDFKKRRNEVFTTKNFTTFKKRSNNNFDFSFKIKESKVYETSTDNRSAWGDAIGDIAQLNAQEFCPLVVFDCDLQGSVKTAEFEKHLPEHFIQTGIMEHHAAVCSGALSTESIQTFFADFGVFGIDETYNQHRLNDINKTNLKIILTHVGLDVGEDGKTHQCIDYISLVRNLYNFKLIIPADPNQTYKAINYLVNQQGNYLVPMGRSKLDIIKNENEEIYFDSSYTFEYGKADFLRQGSKATIFVTGTITNTAIQVVDELREEGIDIQLINISCPLSIERKTLEQAVKTNLIFTVEDHNVNTGLGSIISDRMIEEQLYCQLIKYGVNNYACSGNAKDVYQLMGLDKNSLKNKIKKVLS